MKCRLGFSGGEQVSGDLIFENGNFTVKYILDGDLCSLEYKNGVLVQRRRGSVCLTLEFEEDCESKCVIGGGELRGELPVFCERLKVSVLDGRVYIFLEYLLDGEKTALDINIIY